MPISPPPNIGDKVYEMGPKGATLHQVRAIVDLEIQPAHAGEESGPWYHVVLRYWSQRRGWVYVIVDPYTFRSRFKAKATS